MALTIKSPSDFPGKGPGKSPTGGKTVNGEPGYKGRTSSPNAVDEVTYERDKPKGGLDIKTPSGPATVTKKS